MLIKYFNLISFWLFVVCYVSLWLRTSPRTPPIDFHPSFIIISFESLVDSDLFLFYSYSHVPKTTSILIDITSFSEIIFITFLHGIKLIPKFIYWSYLHDINLLLKFNLHSSSYIHVVPTTPHASWNIVWLHLHQRLRQDINHLFIFLQLDYLHPHCIFTPHAFCINDWCDPASVTVSPTSSK